MLVGTYLKRDKELGEISFLQKGLPSLVLFLLGLPNHALSQTALLGSKSL